MVTERQLRPEIDLLFLEPGTIEYKRTRLALAALERKSDYILWIDSDQTFPADGLLRLIGHDKPIIGANYRSRHGPHGTALDLASKKLPRRTGTEIVGAVGFGFCLIRTPVLELMPRPWFATEMGADGGIIYGEDVHFCNQARAAGFDTWVDHDLDVGHVAEQILHLKRETADAVPALPPAGP